MSASGDSVEDHNQFDSAQLDTHALSPAENVENPMDDGLEPISFPHHDDSADPSSPSTTSDPYDSQNMLLKPLEKGKQKGTEDFYSDVDMHAHDYEDRSNRFHGPPSTWMSWTREERHIANSLTEIRNSDLSAHLFNAHALEIRKRRAQAAAAPESDNDTSFSFVPGKAWTAWPMPPSEVPRGIIEPVYDPSEQTTYSKEKDPRVSSDLEDCLLASVLRVAKERFSARQWEDEPQDPQSSNADQSLTIPMDKTPTMASHAAVFSSQAFRDDSEDDSDDHSAPEPSSRTHEKGPYAIEGLVKPVLLADEEEARRLLLPMISQTMSQLDSLFDNLHKSRQAYAADSETSDEDSGVIRTSIGRHRSRSRSRRRRRSRSAIAAQETKPEQDEATSQSRSSYRTSPNRKGSTGSKKDYLSPRDWSDILAIAAIGSWEPAVVERAANRCATLFEEDMRFRTFYEGTPQEPSFFTEITATRVEPTDVQIPLRPADDNGVEASSEEDSSEKRLICPYGRCRTRQRSFQNARNLHRHIRKYHTVGNVASNIFSRDTTDEDAHMSTTTEQDVDRKYYCPIQSCKRHSKPFSRSTKMYSHIKSTHSEVNLTEVKRAESKRRGERRGRPRKRSQLEMTDDTES